MGQAKKRWMEIEERGYGEIDKFICPNCVGDKYMKSWIDENSTGEAYCDYCGEFSRCVPMEVFQEKINSVIRAYYTIAEGELPYDSEEGCYLGTTFDTEELLSDLNSELEADEAVLDDLKESFADITWCYREPLRLSETEIRLSSWNDFVNSVKYNTRYFFFTKKDDYYGESYSPLSILNIIGEEIENFKLIKELPEKSSFYRARSTDGNCKEFNGKTLGSPPYYCAAANRMSAEGISAFYASETQDTAASEVRDVKKDIIIAEFENLKPLTYIDMTEIENLGLPSFFDLENKRERDAIIFLRSLNKELVRPIEDLKAIEYVPTQIFAEYCRSVMKVDGIKYRSSKDKTGKCYVFFIDNEECYQTEVRVKFYKPQRLRLKDYFYK